MHSGNISLSKMSHVLLKFTCILSSVRPQFTSPRDMLSMMPRTTYLVVLLAASILLTVQCMYTSPLATAAEEVISSSFSGQHLLLSESEYVTKDNHGCLPDWGELSDRIFQYVSCSEAQVLRCYCLTPTNTTYIKPSEIQYVLGHCLQGCFITNKFAEFYNVSTHQYWMNGLCSKFNREGTLCGACKSGYGPPVYSFSIRCVPCRHVTLWKRILLYIAVAYGPLTVFLIIIVVFTVSVNSAPLHGWIFVCQILASSFYMRVLTSMAKIHHIDQYSYRILGTIYGIWNLDFFRSVYRPFCLHSSLTTLQVMSLDYIIAAYPLVIIVIMYVLVDLHSRDCRPVVVMWRPFHYCFARFRHQLNIRTSLVDAFGTFFSLSYVKMFSTEVDLMTTSKVWNGNYTTSFHLYADGTEIFFKKGHLPFAVLSLFLLLVFNILPLVLILLYAFPKTQSCIHCLPNSLQHILYPFMDNILSCYKDGTNGTRNCRYFAIVYQVSRMVIWSSFMWTESTFFYSVATVVVIITGILLTLIRPYKSAVYNALDTFLVLTLALALVGTSAFFLATVDDPRNTQTGLAMTLLPISISFIYIFCCLGYEVCAVQRLPQTWARNIFSRLQSLIHRRREDDAYSHRRREDDVYSASETASLIQ